MAASGRRITSRRAAHSRQKRARGMRLIVTIIIEIVFVSLAPTSWYITGKSLKIHCAGRKRKSGARSYFDSRRLLSVRFLRFDLNEFIWPARCLLHVSNCAPWKMPSPPPQRRCKINDVKVSRQLFQTCDFSPPSTCGRAPFCWPTLSAAADKTVLRSLSAPQRPLWYAKTSVIYFIGACIPAAEMAAKQMLA